MKRTRSSQKQLSLPAGGSNEKKHRDIMTNQRNEMKTTNQTNRRRPRRSALAIGALAVLLCGGLAALAGNDNRAPEVPDAIAVPGTTNKVHFHGFGVGVQIYTWDGASWGRAVPEATLFHGDGIVATH